MRKLGLIAIFSAAFFVGWYVCSTPFHDCSDCTVPAQSGSAAVSSN